MYCVCYVCVFVCVCVCVCVCVYLDTAYSVLLYACVFSGMHIYVLLLAISILAPCIQFRLRISIAGGGELLRIGAPVRGVMVSGGPCKQFVSVLLLVGRLWKRDRPRP